MTMVLRSARARPPHSRGCRRGCPRGYLHGYSHGYSRGFTLIELLIGVVIVGLLAALALPAFFDSIRKSRRTEAVRALAAVQQAQERVRGNWPAYCSNLSGPQSPTACGLGLSATSTNGYYAITLTNVSANGYDAVASATGSQVADARCAVMAARMVMGGNLLFDAGASTPSFTAGSLDPNNCWPK